jgi:type VI secretion system VasD/TssJ family lipoprotein
MGKKSGSFLPLLISVLFLGNFAGCTSHLLMTVKGSTNLNNGGNTVVVRIYQLRSDANFIQARIESFWEDEGDTKILRDDIVGTPIKIVLSPGEIRKFKIEFSEETKYIGATANFFDPDRDGWHRSYSLASNKSRSVWISVGKDAVFIEEGS